jgi:hypothetical protein
VSLHSDEAGKRQTKWNFRSRFLRRMAFGIVGVVIMLGFAAHVENINQRRGIESSRATGLSYVPERSFNARMLVKGLAAQARSVQAAEMQQETLIARNVSLNISVRNFVGAHSAVDRIVKAHAGYMASMTVSSPEDTSQSLSASIAIPAAQCDAVLAEFKTLGHVEQERQSAEEVTSQSEDLDIRLKNSRETETRLTGILRLGTTKVADVLDVEKEIVRVRGEIERMEAEQKRLNNRVAFASIDLNLTEEFQAQLGGTSLIGLQVRNGIVGGYHAAEDGLVGALVFFLSVGPSLIIWALILFWPTRWAWRRWRQSRPDGPEISQSQ